MSEYRLNFVRRLAEHDGLTLSEDFVLSSDDFDALPTPVDFADFIQAVARIGGVVALERQAGDRYTTKVRGEVQGWLPPRSFTPNWHPQQDNHRAYAADLHVNPTTTGTPVVVFFVASAARAGTSTISLMQYREWDLGVQPVVAYKPKSITSQVVYRLQNAADDDSNVIPVSSDSHGFRTLRRRLVESGVAVAAS
jgi:hypothetical protein